MFSSYYFFFYAYFLCNFSVSADSSQLEVELTECLNMLDKQLTFHHFEAIIFVRYLVSMFLV